MWKEWKQAIANLLFKLFLTSFLHNICFLHFVGDPTIFGNLRPSDGVVEAVVESVRSMNYNGYAPSTGK